MDFAKLEFFKITKVLKLVTYKLDFPNSIKITRIYHILVLKLADPEALLIKDMPDINPKSQEKVWEVKKLLNTDLINNN